MLKRFLQELHSLAGPDALRKRYLLAVSGGADSSVMAVLFHKAELQFAFAHCNFHLRGDDSDRDMRFVKDMAARWNVPIFIREFDTLNIQKDSGKSVEMVARELRYKWFEEILANFDHLATAHHANDAAETQLLNLTRGTGLKGLCSIPPVNGKTIRPMLPFTAEEIRQYAQEQHIAYMDDYTNQDEKISRNRIRHSVIPQLEALNPQFLHTNIHTREILQRQYAYYQKHIETAIAKISSEQNNQIQIDRSLLEACEDKELILYEILNRFGFSSDVSEKLSESSQLQPGKQFLSDTHVLLVDRAFLIIKTKMDEEPETIVINTLDDLQHYFCIEEFEYQQDIIFDKNPNVFYIPKEKLTFPVLIRKWNPGDWFHPLGAKGRQKLSDYFTDHKIDRFAKERIHLLSINDQIAWIIGHRSDERFKVTPQTEKYYLLRPLALGF